VQNPESSPESVQKVWQGGRGQGQCNQKCTRYFLLNALSFNLASISVIKWCMGISHILRQSSSNVKKYQLHSSERSGKPSGRIVLHGK